MITLKVEDYCQNCPDFEPRSEKFTYEGWDNEKLEHMCRRDTFVTCENALKCSLIASRLKEKMKNI